MWEILVMEESKIKRAQFLGGLWLELQAMMAYTKETGVDGKRADYNQLLRRAQTVREWGQSQWCNPLKLWIRLVEKGARLMEFLPGSLISERRTIWRSRHAPMNVRMRLELTWICMNSSWEYQSIWLRQLQHYKKAGKRCFVCDDPSHFTRDCPQWEQFWQLEI